MNIKDTINGIIADIFDLNGQYNEKMLTVYNTELLDAYKNSLDNIKKKIAEMYEKYGDDVDLATMASYNRLKNLENEIKNEILNLKAQAQKITTSAIKDQFAENYYVTGYAIENTLGLKAGFGQLNKAQIDAAVLNPYDKIGWPERMKDHSIKLVKKVKQTVTEGLIQGYGYGKTSRMIKEDMGKSAKEMLRIIRTESHRAQSAGRIAGFQRSEQAAERLGIEVKRIWLATLDSKTRADHRYMDGKAADKEGKFHLPGGILADGPGLSGVAREDINCRCTTIIKVKDIPYKVRKDNVEKSIIKYKTYKEWKKEKKINFEPGPAKAGKVKANNPLDSYELAKKFKKRLKQQGLKSEFIPAKTIKEAEEWAIKNGLAYSADYSKLDIDKANLINKQFSLLNKTGQKFHNIKPFKGKKNKYKLFEVSASTDVKTGVISRLELYYNPENVNNIEKYIRELNEKKLIKNLTPEGAITHEYGHFVDIINEKGWDVPSLKLDELMSEKFGNMKQYFLNQLRELAGDYIGSNSNEQFAEMYRLWKQGKLPKDFKFLDKFFKELKQ